MGILGKIFGKKKQAVKGWYDIPLATFEEIAAISNDDEGAKALRIARAVYGETGGNIDFVTTDCPKAKPRKRYWLAGREYYLQGDITGLTMSQYIDATNAKTTAELLAVILIPRHHKYNDGYDLDRVKRDVATIATPDALGLSFFLAKQVANYVKHIRYYLNATTITQPANAATTRRLITFLQSMERLILSRVS